ncbi:MAG: IS4 family transposase, partial [Candidatus Glassbacteria bacterium]
IAISVYILMAIVKKRLKLEHSLGEILQILSITLLEKDSILQALTASYDKSRKYVPYKQLA